MHLFFSMDTRFELGILQSAISKKNLLHALNHNKKVGDRATIEISDYVRRNSQHLLALKVQIDNIQVNQKIIESLLNQIMTTPQIWDYVRRNSQHLLALKVQIDNIQVNQEIIETLLNQIVVLPKDVLIQIEDFVKMNRDLGVSTKEDFLKDAAITKLRHLKIELEYREALTEKMEKADRAIKEQGLPFLGVIDYLEQQLDTLLKNCEGKNKNEE